MKKKIISLLLVVLTVFSALPFGISAANAPISSCVDLAELDKDTFGSGYQWDNLDRTLTLEGMNINTSDIFGLKLPAGATIIINGNNSITAASYGIQSLGGMTFKGDGTLTVTAALIGISGVSSQEKQSVVFRSGNITVNSSKNGIYAESSEIVFSGASVKVSAGENSIFGKNIKTVSGNVQLNGKIKAKGSVSISNTALTVSAADTAITAERGITFKDVKLSVGDSPSALKGATEYGGEKAIKTVGTLKESKNGFLFGGTLPAFVDYIVISLIVLAVAAVIVVPIIIKWKKTSDLLAQSKANNSKNSKKK